MISRVANAYEERADLQPMHWEIAGAFGDIGILFPIAIALISLCHVNPTPRRTQRTFCMAARPIA